MLCTGDEFQEKTGQGESKKGTPVLHSKMELKLQGHPQPNTRTPISQIHTKISISNKKEITS